MVSLRDVMSARPMRPMTAYLMMMRGDGRHDRVGGTSENEDAQKQTRYNCVNNPTHILLFPGSSAGKTYSTADRPSIDLLG